MSPASNALTPRAAPPPIKIASASMPCFLKKPRSSAIQIALLVGLKAPMPMRTLSRPQALATKALVSAASKNPQ
jgi:hypothetical protein